MVGLIIMVDWLNLLVKLSKWQYIMITRMHAIISSEDTFCAQIINVATHVTFSPDLIPSKNLTNQHASDVLDRFTNVLRSMHLQI